MTCLSRRFDSTYKTWSKISKRLRLQKNLFCSFQISVGFLFWTCCPYFLWTQRRQQWLPSVAVTLELMLLHKLPNGRSCSATVAFVQNHVSKSCFIGFQENEPRRSFHERRGTCHYSHYNYQQAPDARSSSRCTWYSFRSNKALVTDVVVIFWHLVSCHHCCHHYLDRSESLGFVLMFLAALSFIFTLSNTIPDCSWTLCVCMCVEIFDGP